MIESVPVFFGLIGLFLLFLGLHVLCIKRVRPGEAGVRSGFGGMQITKDWLFRYPFLHRWNIMDIRVKKLKVSRKGKEALICQDKNRVDIEVSFYLRVRPEYDAIKEVAETVGCEVASDPEFLRNLFEDKFIDALNAVAKQMDCDLLHIQRSQFREMIANEIGQDLGGYQLEDVAISYLE
ncbi:MAG: SPFH domain-containing protein [Verrucomicrobiota bacterium]|nr:SPFH domain-containing protein [Verrucomicrobiota bacterium]